MASHAANSCQPAANRAAIDAGNHAAYLLPTLLTTTLCLPAANLAATCCVYLLPTLLTTMLCLPAANIADNHAAYLLPTVLTT
jgi:hypothetical protein